MFIFNRLHSNIVDTYHRNVYKLEHKKSLIFRGWIFSIISIQMLLDRDAPNLECEKGLLQPLKQFS